MISSKGSLIFTFEGDYEVNVETVIQAIQSVSTITTVLADNAFPDATFKLSVKAVSPGSLNLEFVSVAQYFKDLLTPENLEIAKYMMDAVIASFRLKQFLQDKKPKKAEETDDKLIVTKDNGETISVPKTANVYFIDKRIDNSVTNIFNGVKSEASVSGIKLTQVENRECVEIPSDEFEECAIPTKIDFDNAGKEMSTVRKNDVLFIKKPDLMGNSKWSFQSDKVITAEIKDDGFLQKIKSGKQGVCAGMYIVADLELKYKLNALSMPIENTYKYTVLKVHEIKRQDEDEIQLSLEGA